MQVSLRQYLTGRTETADIFSLFKGSLSAIEKIMKKKHLNFEEATTTWMSDLFNNIEKNGENSLRLYTLILNNRADLETLSLAAHTLNDSEIKKSRLAMLRGMNFLYGKLLEAIQEFPGRQQSFFKDCLRSYKKNYPLQTKQYNLVKQIFPYCYVNIESLIETYLSVLTCLDYEESLQGPINALRNYLNDRQHQEAYQTYFYIEKEVFQEKQKRRREIEDFLSDVRLNFDASQPIKTDKTKVIVEKLSKNYLKGYPKITMKTQLLAMATELAADLYSCSFKNEKGSEIFIFPDIMILNEKLVGDTPLNSARKKHSASLLKPIQGQLEPAMLGMSAGILLIGFGIVTIGILLVAFPPLAFFQALAMGLMMIGFFVALTGAAGVSTSFSAKAPNFPSGYATIKGHLDSLNRAHEEKAESDSTLSPSASAISLSDEDDYLSAVSDSDLSASECEPLLNETQHSASFNTGSAFFNRSYNDSMVLEWDVQAKKEFSNSGPG